MKAAFVVKFLVCTLVNTIADYAVGKFSWLSLGIRALVFAGSAGLRTAGAKLLAQYSRAAKGGSALSSFGDDLVDFTDEFAERAIRQSGKNNCGQTCAIRLALEQGIEQVKHFFSHQNVTDADELASFLSKNGVAGAKASDDIDFFTLINKVGEGKPAIALTKKASGQGHWVMIDQVEEIGGIPHVLLRDPATGVVGYMHQTTFFSKYFIGKAVYLE